MTDYVIIGRTYRHDETGKTLRVFSASRVTKAGRVELRNASVDAEGWAESWTGNIATFCQQWTEVKVEPRMQKSEDKMIKKYRIEKLSDFLSVPEDRLSTCLSEFQDALETMHTLTVMTQTIDSRTPPVTMDQWTWIDDGRKDRNIRLNLGPTLDDMIATEDYLNDEGAV